MKVILHMGAAKTGTTSLQKSLFDSRSILEKHNVLYPSNFKGEIGHHVLLGLYRATDRGAVVRRAGGKDNLEKTAACHWEEIKRQIARKKPEVVILSSEKFFHGDVESFQKLRSRLFEVSDDILPCAYIREPVSRYVSGVQQKAKHNGKVSQPAPQKIRENIEAIENVFGRKPSIRAFERQQLYKQDTVADFEHTYLRQFLPAGTLLTTRRNESISAEAAAILSRYRKFALADAESFPMPSARKLMDLINDYEAARKRHNKPLLKPHIKELLLSRCEEFIWLKDKYRVEFESLDYSKIKENRDPVDHEYSKIEEIIEVDEDWRDEIMFNVLHDRLVLPRPRSTNRRSSRRIVEIWRRKENLRLTKLVRKVK